MTPDEAQLILTLIASRPSLGGLGDYFTSAERERLSRAAVRRLGGAGHGREAIIEAYDRNIDDGRRIAQALAALIAGGALDPVLSPSRREWMARVLHLVATKTRPDAPVVDITPERNGAYTCVAECPWCPPNRNGRPRRHTHGLPGGAADLPTERGSHCAAGPGPGRPYLLVAAELAA